MAVTGPSGERAKQVAPPTPVRLDDTWHAVLFAKKTYVYM